MIAAAITKERILLPMSDRIPDYQTLMRPLLELHADGMEHINRNLVNRLAEQFNLTEEDGRQLLPSGRAKTFENRVAWAKTYVVKAGLLMSPRRAVSVITPAGLRLLEDHSGPINLRVLSKFDGFVAFRDRTGKEEESQTESEVETDDEETPEETFENAYSRIRSSVEQEIIRKILGNPPDFLERVIVDLIVRMGYGGNRKDAGEAIGRSGDEGIDGIIKEDPLGLDVIYLQAKRYEGTIGRPDIQRFAGALQGQRAKKGIFITTSSFSREAKDFAARIDSKIILIDGSMLARLMFDHGVGVSVSTVYEVKRVDTDYFEDA